MIQRKHEIMLDVRFLSVVPRQGSVAAIIAIVAAREWPSTPLCIFRYNLFLRLYFDRIDGINGTKGTAFARQPRYRSETFGFSFMNLVTTAFRERHKRRRV